MEDKSCELIDLNQIDEIMNASYIIFGAGMYGNILYSFLKMKRLSKHLTAFAVSDRKGNPNQIDGIPVKETEKLRSELEESTVLLAIGKTHAQEAISLLQGYGVRKLYGVTAEIIEVISREIYNEMRPLPLEQNKIFISCFEGMGYRCSCKYIAEELIRGNYPVKLVWVVTDENISDLPECITRVTAYTSAYYRELYTSKICITNSTINLFGIKKEGQYYINTWHGYGPFKRVQGSWSINRERLDEIKRINANYDLFLTGSTFYSQVYRDSFLYEGEICECGAPRNDLLFAEGAGIRDSVCRQFSIPEGKRIVLYAPTFRTGTKNSFDRYDLDMPAVLEALSARFHGEFVLMYRFHHYLHAIAKCQGFYDNGIDATYYPDIQELLVAADVVITDYSSLMWDFSLQRRPVFLYQNDEDEYLDDRGFYCPVSQWPYPKARKKEELLDIIEHFDNEKYMRELNEFLKKYGSCDDGNASRKAVEKIMNVIENQA